MNTNIDRDEDLVNVLAGALAARTAQITQADLRPPVTPMVPQREPQVSPFRRIRERGWLRPIVTSGAIASVAASIFVTGYVGSGPSDPGHSAPGDASPAAYVVSFEGGTSEEEQLQLLFRGNRSAVQGTAATTIYPSVSVTGGSSEVRRSIRQAVDAQVTAEIDTYRQQLVRLDETGRPLTQRITVRSDDRWGHTVSIVLDVVNDFGGAVPSNTSTAVVIDRRTGDGVAATDLFMDVPAIETAMRAALQETTQPVPATPSALASLKMTPGPNGLTTPLTWYPSEHGLTWVVDRGAIASDAQGEPTVSVPWPALASYVARDRDQ